MPFTSFRVRSRYEVFGGEKEKHEVEFSYEVMWGKVKIAVDGKEHTTTRVMLVGFTPFIFQVGEKEMHQVKIELNNPIGFAVRGSDVKGYVDEKMVA